MSLRVVLHPAAERELKSIHKGDREGFERIRKVIERFAETGKGDVSAVSGPRPAEKLPALLRLRVGAWRIFFGVFGNESMYVVGIERRPKAYRPWVLEAARRRLREFGVEME